MTYGLILEYDAPEDGPTVTGTIETIDATREIARGYYRDFEWDPGMGGWYSGRSKTMGGRRVGRSETRYSGALRGMMYKEVGQMDPYGAPAPRSERATIYDLSTSMSTTRSNQRHIWLTSETARSRSRTERAREKLLTEDKAR